MLLPAAAGEAAVLALILRRGMVRELPFFFGWMAWVLLSDVAMLVALWRLSSEQYLHLYSANVAIECAFRFLVLVKCVMAAWNDQRTWSSRRAAFLLFSLLLTAMLMLWPFSKSLVPEHLASISVFPCRLKDTESMLFVACWLVLAGRRQQLASFPKNPATQILPGLGLYSAVSLSAASMQTASTSSTGAASSLLAFLPCVAYLALLIYWIVCFSRRIATQGQTNSVAR